MAFPRLKQFASIKGWRIEKNRAYGEENGYIFTLIDGQGFKAFLSPLPSTDEYNQKDVLDYLDKNKKMLGISEFMFDNEVLIIKLKETLTSTKIETMNNLLKELTDFLKSKGIKGKECCIFCSNDNAEQTVYIDNIMYSAHGECYLHQKNVVEEATREYEAEDKNYFLGFIGALIGGIVCSIPWIIVQVFLNRIASVLAALIGVGALKAYYMFKGKLGRGTRWIIALCTLISVVFAQFGGIAIEMVQNDIPLQYKNFMLLFSFPEVTRSFMANLALSLFMAFLGIIGLFLELKGNAKSVLPNIEKK